MALQVPSGLITSVSGGGLVSGTTLPLFSYPIPVVIVGANGASASGNHSITDQSGALNVNVSGGTISANVSGNVVQIQSGGVAILSGEVHVMSGNVAVLSGIVGVASGTVNVISGVVSVMSGNIAVNSGLITIQGSGSTLFTMLSGNVDSTSGQIISGAWVQPVAAMMYDLSGLQFIPLAPELSGGHNLRVVIAQGGTSTTVSNNNSDAQNPTGGNALWVQNFNMIYNGATFDRARTILGTSGQIVGTLAVGPMLWKYTEVTAAGVTNIYQSGAVALHAVNINDYSSGQTFRVRDSQSGAGGTIVANVAPFVGGLTVTDIQPANLPYDVLLTSGLVVDTSGAGWDLTVIWKNLTS